MHLLINNNKFLKTVLFILCILGCIELVAQKKQGDDSLYIKNFSHQNSIQFFTGKWSRKFLIPIQFENRRVSHVFFPNNGIYNGIFLSYKWFSIAYSIKSSIIAPYPSLKGLKADNLNLFKFWDHFGVNFDKVKMEGLLYRQNRYKKSLQVLKNLKYVSYTTDFYYFFNKRYSYRASAFSSKKQLKSAGSPIIIVSPSINKIYSSTTSDSIPTRIRANVLFEDPKWFSMRSAIGYGYNLSLYKGKFIVNPSVFYNLVFNNRNNSHSVKFSDGFRFSINAGYHGDKYFGLINANVDKYKNKFSKGYFEQLNSDVSLSVGLRF